MSHVAEAAINQSRSWATFDAVYENIAENPVFKLVQPHQTRLVTPLTDTRSHPSSQQANFSIIDEEVRQAFHASLDRVFLRRMSMTEREGLFHSYVNGFYSLLSEEFQRGDTAYFTSTPHFHWDIALSICLQQLGWEVRCFTLSAKSDRLLVRRIAGSQTAELVKLESGDTTGHQHHESETANLQQSRAFNRRVIEPRRMSLMSSLRFVYRMVTTVLRPQRFHYFSEPWFKLVVRGFRWQSNRLKLRGWLKANGIVEVPTTDYVYFALASQPERSTVPDAGVFWYQLNAISELRRALPAEMVLIVREHPRQIGRQSPDLRQTHYRSVDDYKRIGAMNNTHIAQWSLDSERLIESAQFVATCTGSAGWEALCAGRPALSFSNTWFSGVTGSIVWSGTEDNAQVLQELIQVSDSAIRSGRRAVLSRTEEFGVPGLDASVEKLPGHIFGFGDEDWEAERTAMSEKLGQLLRHSTS